MVRTCRISRGWLATSPAIRALGIDSVEVDRRVANAVGEGGQVAGQFQRPARPSRGQ